jgi:hypothetical protein
MLKTRPGGFVKAKTSLLIIVLRGAAVYAVSYGLYWWAASMIGSPQDFRSLWAKALTPLGVMAAAYYFNRTDQAPRK